MPAVSPSRPVSEGDEFARRHLGPAPQDIERMLESMGVPSLDALIDEVVPQNIRTKTSLGVGPARSEAEALETLRGMPAPAPCART